MATPWDRLLGSRAGSEESKSPFAAVLARVPLFENLSKRELVSIDRILHRRDYVQDEIVFRQGEPGMGLYVIQQGEVSIVSEPSNELLFEMRDGDFFGEVALLDAGPRSATAIARTNSTLLGFFQPDLFDLIDRNPRLGVKVVLSVARHIGLRLRQANEKVLALVVEMEAAKKKLDSDNH